MQVAIRKMGNSHGVLIPKPMLTEAGLSEAAELTLNKGVIEIRPIQAKPRAGWANDAQQIAQAGTNDWAWADWAGAAAAAQHR